jgi:hypothetical protein
VTGYAQSLTTPFSHAFLYSGGANHTLDGYRGGRACDPLPRRANDRSELAAVGLSVADVARYTLVSGRTINDLGQIAAVGYVNADPAQNITTYLPTPANVATTTSASAAPGVADYGSPKARIRSPRPMKATGRRPLRPRASSR